MSYTEKNKGKIVLVVIGILLILVVVGLWLQKRFFHTIADMDAQVYPSVISVGDTLYYEDKTSFSAFREWRFGDGNISINDKGYYLYRKPGYYQIKLTLNGKYTKTFPIQVKEVLHRTITDSITTIDAPKEAMQFENIVFRAHSRTAKLYSWKFGESGMVDAKEPMAIYAYQNPGVYQVTLYTDQTEYPITHNINILPSFKVLKDSTSIDNIYKRIDDDFKYHLQQIAKGADFNKHYNYLTNTYLCKNENTPIKVNTGKINTFYYYCAGLRFDKNAIINDVKVTFDEAMNCIVRVNIVQESP
ncbi:MULTISPECIES: PKD domain-containing protein [Capnocytophaga]|nr:MULTISPECIES: PKD domain-containing protein [Capnocytophaga]AWL77988.1 PKD domain-containing protein [Capnocytophaga canimorsus]AYW36623.1 PKD domain-containing protein [Capnocytophaga canimorsus]MDT9499293.1 PKD domain-containing protein [Capnocytophaga canimorsus]GIM56744.1 hypothetical protein CAPN006_11380 [Capnocytophaga canimorsus]